MLLYQLAKQFEARKRAAETVAAASNLPENKLLQRKVEVEQKLMRQGYLEPIVKEMNDSLTEMELVMNEQGFLHPELITEPEHELVF